MKDRFELTPGRRALEGESAHRRAVEAAVWRKHVRAERTAYGVDRRASRRGEGVGDEVGVDHAGPKGGEMRCSCALAAADAAFELVSEFDPAEGPACAIIKHANPCGVAQGASALEAYKRAFDCDRTSAFGGIIALNQPLDGATAEEIVKIFTEVVIAPDADADARRIFAAKKNLRLLTTGGLPDPRAGGLTFRQVSGGMLIQGRDNGHVARADLRIVSDRQPSEQELADLMFAWTVAKHVKSNAIVYAKDLATVGIGAGQMSRVDSTRIGRRKSEDMAQVLGLSEPLTNGAAVASDAFFPFADGIEALAEAGARAVIQPGGSMRDDEVIAAANRLGLAMVLTGQRHFRH